MIEKQMVEILIKEDQFQIKISIGQRVKKLVNILIDLSKNNPSILKKQQIFRSFQRKGKYKHAQFSYSDTDQIMAVYINKQYFFRVLNHKQYQLAMIARHMITVWQQFSQQLKYFVKSISELSKNDPSFQIIKIDAISITISKEYYSLDIDGNVIINKFFLRESNFEYRNNFSYKPRQEEHLFCVYREVFKADKSRDFVGDALSTDQKFYKCQRLNFIDDLHTNQSLIKRFCVRLMPFYQAFVLYNRQTNFKPDKYVREFYRKCVNQSYFYAMRLKKMGFTFSLKRLVKERENRDKAEIEKEKTHKISLTLFYEDQLAKTVILKNNRPEQYNRSSFSIETFYPEFNDRNLNQSFLTNLKKIKSTENEGEESEQFMEVLTKNQSRKLILRPRNQSSFCRILTEFTFFLDRVFFKMMDMKDRKKSFYTQNQLVVSATDDFGFKLPPSEEFTLSQSKFIYYYWIEIKSYANRKSGEGKGLRRGIKDNYQYQTELVEVKMIRRKKANTDDPQKDYEFFQKHSSDFKGLKLYINTLLNMWNVREIYQDIIDFISSYLNIVSEKLKDKPSLKNLGKWSQVIGGIQAILQFMTQGFNSQQNTCKLSILQGFQDNKQGSQPGFFSDIPEHECVITLTFSLYQLKPNGWKPTIPFCTFLFKVYKSSIILVSSDNQKLLQFPLQCTKKKMEIAFKDLLKKIYKNQLSFPSLFYE